MRCFLYAGLIALVASAIFGQSADAPKFEIADIHSRPLTANAFLRASPPRNGRYELKNASMLDLIRTAWDYTPDTIVGGPNWLELDRFDVIAKIPPDADTDAQKAMLRSLLEERFKLVVRKETKAVATWVLAAGKQPHLKEADGSGETGCKIGTGEASSEGPRLTMMNQDGTATTITIGPGGTIQYNCRNMTMPAFAAGLGRMMGVQVGTEPVIDQTGLKGAWNFDVRWSMGLLAVLQQGDQIPATDAIEKQLGLKLEQRPVSKQVLVVESVNRTPTANPAGVAEALPDLTPKEFEVAEVKLSPPADGLPRGAPIRMMPGGRFVANGYPLRALIFMAFQIGANSDKITGLPSGIDSIRLDITAKVPAETATGPGLDPEILSPLLRSLLVDRFGLKYHEEERQMTAYSLVAAKPKMKKADSDSRIFCKRVPAPAGSPAGSQTLTCQNATMALLAQYLPQMYPALNWAVVDATGIEGGWDFSLTFNVLPPGMLLNGAGRGGDAGPQSVVPNAADPGGGYTIFEAIEKQLGLKLKAEKRPEQVIVIDHLEQKPSEN